MTLKILVIGDVGNNFTYIKKFMKDVSIDLINFPKHGASQKTYSNEGEFFESIRISKQIEKINERKYQYDIFIVNSWAGARIAFLSGLKYIIYFTGDDIRSPPFLKNRVKKYLQNPLPNLNFFERVFYKKILKKATYCVTSSQELFFELKKYRTKYIECIELTRDTSIFNENPIVLDKEKEKFTFLSPHRNGLEKGTEKIWDALELCKSDFDVIIIDWFDNRNPEEKEIEEKLRSNKPKQVKFIPIIKREEMPAYYAYADAIIGQMRLGYHGAVEMEAAFCKRPVVHFSDPKIKYKTDTESIISPFLPHSNEPKKIAEIIDKIVTNKVFREKLQNDENEFMKKISDPTIIAEQWKKLIEKNKTGIVHESKSFFSLFVKIFVFVSEKMYYNNKMQEKNIQVFGKKRYNNLTK